MCGLRVPVAGKEGVRVELVSFLVRINTEFLCSPTAVSPLSPPLPEPDSAVGARMAELGRSWNKLEVDRFFRNYPVCIKTVRFAAFRDRSLLLFMY